MTLEQAGIIIAILTAIVSFAGIIYNFGAKLARLETKTDTMWDFLMRRAISEGLNRGIVKISNKVNDDE